MMQAIQLDQAIFYIVKDDVYRLVDIRLSVDKFSGPGMVRDLFYKVVNTQEVISVINLDQDAIDAIIDGRGSYSGKLILKSSAFHTVYRDDKVMPLYATVRYQT